MGTAYYADLRWSLVPKLQLGNPEGEALASRNGKLELPSLYMQVSSVHCHSGRDCRNDSVQGCDTEQSPVARLARLFRYAIHGCSATAPVLLYLLHPCSRGSRQSLPG